MRGCRKGLRVSLQVIPAAVNIQVQKRNETNKSNLRRWRHNATMLQCCAHLLSQLFVKLILVRKPGRGYDCSHVVCACGEGGRCLCCCGSGFGRRISCVPVRERRERYRRKELRGGAARWGWWRENNAGQRETSLQSAKSRVEWQTEWSMRAEIAGCVWYPLHIKIDEIYQCDHSIITLKCKY